MSYCCYGSSIPESLEENPTSTKKILKIVVLGNSGVGKSTLIKRIVNPDCKDLASDTSVITLGVSYNGITLGGIECDIWDTAGQEKYRSIAPFYIRNSDICVIAYSLVDEQSKEDIRIWEELAFETAPTAINVIIATKLDMLTEEPEMKLSHIALSSFTGKGFDELTGVLTAAAKCCVKPYACI